MTPSRELNIDKELFAFYTKPDGTVVPLGKVDRVDITTKSAEDLNRVASQLTEDPDEDDCCNCNECPYVDCECRDEDYYIPEIIDVIFNGPATIVFWDDGTKTIVKCQKGDKANKETGLAMAIAKKAFGNKGSFNDIFKMFIEDYDKRQVKEKETAECSSQRKKKETKH